MPESRCNYVGCFIIVCLTLIFITPFFSYVLPFPSSNPSHPWLLEFLVISVLVITLFFRSSQEKILLVENEKYFAKLLIPFIFWGGISVFWALDTFSVMHFLSLWFIYLSCFVLFSSFLKKAFRDALFNAFVVSILIVGTCCVFESLTTAFRVPSVTITFRVRYGKYAEIVTILVPLFLGLYLQTTGKKKLVFLASVLVGFLAVLQSLSRSANLALLIALVIFFFGVFLRSKRTYRHRAVFLLTLCLVVLGASMLTSFFGGISVIEYVSNESFGGNDTVNARFFFWAVTLKMIENSPALGVGADNYWRAFTQAKMQCGDTCTAIEPALAETHFVQRAHNEFLQIVAELGFIGMGLFLLPFGFLFVIVCRAIFSYKVPPVLWGAVSGMVGFAVSSMFSSFSFRFVLSGISFFFVTAVALREAEKILNRKLLRQTEIAKKGILLFETLLETLKVKKLQWFSGSFVFGIWIALGIVFLLITALANVSQLLVGFGERETDFNAKIDYFEKALWLNPENPTAYYYLGLVFYDQGDMQKASAYLRKGIEKGFDAGLPFLFLASAERVMGDKESEGNTLEKAVSIYPRSVFFRVRYAMFLWENGFEKEAQSHWERALEINEEQAKGWFELMKFGPQTFQKNKTNAEGKSISSPMDLEPLNYVYAVIYEQNRFFGFNTRISPNMH